MLNKKVSISLLLALALGFGGCNSDPTPKPDPTPKETGNQDNQDNNETVDDNKTTPVADTTAPVFEANINTNPTLKEGVSIGTEVITIKATDENEISFSLAGADANSFTTEAITDGNGIIIKTKTEINYESKDEYDISVIATDSEGNSATKDLIISVIDEPFRWDVTGYMGSVQQYTTKSITLTTKEATGSVSYSVSGDHFRISDNNTLTFSAPTYQTSGGNTYTATVTANDGSNEINLKITANVNKDGNIPTKTYRLIEKNIVAGGINIKYFYNDDNYLSKVEKTQGEQTEITTYTYTTESNYTIMKGWTDDAIPINKSIRVFENKQPNTKNKFASDLSLRLSIDEHTNYIVDIADSIIFQQNKQLIKFIDLGNSGNKTEAVLYVYNDNGAPSRTLSGNYTIAGYQIRELNDTQLITPNVPTGGFPPANTRLTQAQQDSLATNPIMPFDVSRETTFEYSDDKLDKLWHFLYGEPYSWSEGVTTSYYSDKVLMSVNSISNSEKYSNTFDNKYYGTDRLLTEQNNKKYIYDVNGTRVEVKELTLNDVLVATYIFEEE